MKIQLPNLNKMPNVNKAEVFLHLKKLSLFETFVSYFIDSSFARGVELKNWCLSQVDNVKLKEIVDKEKWTSIVDEDVRVKAILKYWSNGGKGGLIYKGDKETYGTNEYWATVEEILTNLRDDCDGFANVIYHSCRLAGIDDNRLYVVAGNVSGGGHCYVVYLANNGLEYPIDGCYWTSISYQMNIPYCQREEYFNGTYEWFRFNSSGCYKSKPV